jgi:hypothetical protein
MNGDRILLFELRERVSERGNRYLSGWLGKASVVAFLDREAEEPTWQVFVSTPTPRPADNGQPEARQSSRPRRAARIVPTGELDDDGSDISRGTT